MPKDKYKKNERRQKEIVKAQGKNISKNELSQNFVEARKKSHRLPTKLFKENLVIGLMVLVFGLIFVFLFKRLNLESYLGIYK